LRWALPLAAFAALVVALPLLNHHPSSTPHPITAQSTDPSTNQDELTAALHAFVTYLEEKDQWPLEFAGISSSSW
ncbi:MAG: hypothetical protein SNJ84_08605, partial [Verrucomicrobiia bacterium]